MDFEPDVESEPDVDPAEVEAECACLVVDDDGPCRHFDPAPVLVATAILCPGGTVVALPRPPRRLDCGHARTCHPAEVPL